MVEIDVDDLFIDDINIRKEISVDDVQSMVKSVEELGILQNLIVRSIEEDGNIKYGIICGSRRYLASIKANKKTIPCRIIDVDDITAMGISLTENEGRVDIPSWRTIEWIGRMNIRIESDGKIKTKSKIIEKLSEKSGLTVQRIKKYLKIDKLPPKVKILIKKREERTVREREIIKKYVPYEIKKSELPLGTAELIASYLLKISEEQLFRHSLKLCEYSFEIAKKIINILKKSPEKSVDEVFELIIKKSGYLTRTIKFKKDLYTKLEDLSLERRIMLDDLIINLIELGLDSY